MAIFPLTGDLIIASHNPGKVREIGELLDPLGVRAISAGAFGLDEPEETEDSFTGNALLKARAAALGAGLPALADDSGLSVAALGGAPGIYSARWAGPDKDFGIAMDRVHRELGDAQDRRAKFVCALAVALPGNDNASQPVPGEEAVFEGEVSGEIVWPPRGDRGFGYDPIFQPVGHSVTFGEMEPAAKHGMSHRAVAFNRLLAAWKAATPR